MIKKIRLGFFTFLLCSKTFTSVGQDLLSDIKYQLEAGTYLSTKQTPFWLRANQYGIVPLQAPLLTLRASAHKDYDSTRNELQKIKKFGIGYGAWLVGNIGKQSGILLPEAYIKVRYGAFEFYGGRRREIMGLVDTTLTSGSYIWSGNALPIPKIQISVTNYTSIIGHGLISVKGGFAHGWFGNQQYTKGYYLHQKWLYGKIGRDSWKVNIFGGINHMVQWGGYSETLKNDAFSTNNGFFSADTYVYLNVVFPIPWKIPINKYSPYETLNRFGNHLGSLDLGIKIKIKIADIYFYRQTPYEDGQMPEIFLSGDGNYSLSLDLKEKKRVYRVNIGFLDTRRQAGERSNFARFVGKMETHPGEIQDYLNHGQYIEGWSYHNNAIGTPLIIPTQDLIKESQPKGYNLFTADNRIQAFYMSIFGKIANYVYYLQSSYTSSLGRFGLKKDIPFKQFSSHISINIPIKKSNLDSKIDLSFDSGKLYGNNLGVNFFIIKKWN